jgi:arylsulfatase A-like enzyme
VAYARTCRVQRRVGQKRLRRWFQAATSVAAAVALVIGFFFVRSPLFNPGTYRVAGGIPRSATHQRPDILWVVMDTARADRLGVYGYAAPTTPFMDQWARQAIVFERAVANGMWTIPTHASMFTGLPVRQHGMGGPTTWLDDSFHTVAEVLSENGYETALFSNNPLLGPTTNLCQGFQTVRVPWEFLRTIRFSLEFFCERWGITPPVPWLDSGFGSALTNHLVAGWLDSHAGAPVFVFINYMEAHLPYLATKGYRQLFLSDDGVHRSYELRRRAYGEIADFLTFDANVAGYEHVLPFDREVLKRQYDAALRNLDDRVAELIDIFRCRGMLDDTLVVIAADHGEHLETHHMWSHHFLLYDDLIHVPMIIRPPGEATPRRVRTVVQPSDLYPTILRAALGPAAVEPPPYTRDLLEVAQQREQERIAVSHTFGAPPEYVDRLLNADDPEIRHRAFSQTAAVGSRFKYIQSGDGRRELYDLAADPGELENLDHSHRAESRRLEDYVASWRQAVPEYVPRASDKPRIGPDLMELLEALGYVGGED